jgi:hypothetical protein
LEAKVEHGEKQLQASESKRARLTEAHYYSLQPVKNQRKLPSLPRLLHLIHPRPWKMMMGIGRWSFKE